MKLSKLLLALALVGCTPRPAATPGPARRHDALSRFELNRWAVRENLPLYWMADSDGDSQVDPDEVAALLFYPTAGRWVDGGAFTSEFETAYDRLVAASSAATADASSADHERRRLVGLDLDQGRATLVRTDLTGLSPADQAFVGHMMEVARLIDQLYARQTSAAAMIEDVPADDAASQSLFRRNWGPTCVAPATENDPACSAIPGAPKQLVDVYPAELQTSADFCAALAADPDAEALVAPFSVVRREGGKLRAVPYPQAYPEEMSAISAELSAAADAIDDPDEAPLLAYLRAAAASFASNDWQPADEAWSRMNAENSKWYVRVAPDETYWEPCSNKAGFHLTFARINQGSLAWQQKLSPVQQDMEAAIAARAGKPYRARTVTFHLPDFIDIVVNAGDDRDALGATVGQSLPNWGPVANEGRGRTVAMSNLYTDVDSLAVRRAQAESVLDAASLASYQDSDGPGLLGTILHEATHNLGPAHEYEVGGQTGDEAFGGPMASLYEELKAQTGALFLIELIRDRGIISDELAAQTYVDSIVWALGHASRGMYTGTGDRKTYSQVAAIQIGFLIDAGAITWDPAAPAASGADTGAFTIHLARMPGAADAMMSLVAGIKARNDKTAADALAAKYVDGPTVPQAVVAERFTRFPRVSFVYAVMR